MRWSVGTLLLRMVLRMSRPIGVGLDGHDTGAGTAHDGRAEQNEVLSIGSLENYSNYVWMI